MELKNVVFSVIQMKLLIKFGWIGEKNAGENEVLLGLPCKCQIEDKKLLQA